jgi:hypothetical protein
MAEVPSLGFQKWERNWTKGLCPVCGKKEATAHGWGFREAPHIHPKPISANPSKKSFFMMIGRNVEGYLGPKAKTEQ